MKPVGGEADDLHYRLPIRSVAEQAGVLAEPRDRVQRVGRGDSPVTTPWITVTGRTTSTDARNASMFVKSSGGAV